MTNVYRVSITLTRLDLDAQTQTGAEQLMNVRTEHDTDEDYAKRLFGSLEGRMNVFVGSRGKA